MIVKDKDNKIVLAVSLTDWNKDKQQYEEKYGEVPTRQIMLLPKVVMGYKIKPVTIKTADGRIEENIIADNSYNTRYRRKYLPMYSITPDSHVHAVRIVVGHPFPAVKVATQAKIAAEGKAAVQAKVKVEAEAREAAETRVKAEAEAREAAEPKPAAPTKEQ